MNKTVREIAELVGGRVEGDPDVIVKGASGIKEARKGDITFLANSKYQSLLKTTKATAVLVPEGVEVPPGKCIIRHELPSLAFAKIMEWMGPKPVEYTPGIHPTAIMGKNVEIGEEVSIQPYVVIEDEVKIGAHTVIGAGCFIGQETTIGEHTLIYPRVTIRERVTIGNRCIIHSGAVIGSDGFGYATVRGVHHKIPQIGTVVIEDDVEIGANVTIDRARFDKTWIKRGTKIDNLVQIAHNVVIGENSIIVAQAGISGSTTIGKNVIVAGQAGIVGHISIGDNAIIGAQAGVTKNVPTGEFVSGYPAAPHRKAKRLNALMNKLPQIYDRLKKIEQLLIEKGISRRPEEGVSHDETTDDR